MSNARLTRTALVMNGADGPIFHWYSMTALRRNQMGLGVCETGFVTPKPFYVALFSLPISFFLSVLLLSIKVKLVPRTLAVEGSVKADLFVWGR